MYNIKDITYYFTYLHSSKLQFINTINIYIKKNHFYFMSLLDNINDYSIMNIKIIELEEQYKWKNF